MSRLEELLKSNLAFTPAVTCFFVDGNRVLLMRRIQTSTGLGQGIISGVGGKVGDEVPNETAVDALIRECTQEVKMVPVEFKEMGQVTFIWPEKPKWNMATTVFVCTKWRGEPTTTEVAEPKWYDIDNLPRTSMWPDNLYWVSLVLAGKKVNMSFLLDNNANILEQCVN